MHAFRQFSAVPCSLCLVGCATLLSPEDAMVCPVNANVANARYVGPYLGIENNLSAQDMERDLKCANDWKTKHFPKGFVTIFW
jgi:hypothetical protein